MAWKLIKHFPNKETNGFILCIPKMFYFDRKSVSTNIDDLLLANKFKTTSLIYTLLAKLHLNLNLNIEALYFY